ncbi:GNAT family N-acetyltransferase [Croceiramulus getboli]|nr:GNAT family N-acetyltransferase [Flavobacteriaceae bacterium YJPT1-3]
MDFFMDIYRATHDDLNDLGDLFDQYRVFYKQKSNRKQSVAFLKDRLDLNESVLFIARDQERKGIGFTQLYPLFSSVTAQRSWLLNDLYVHPDFRGRGIGQALLRKAKAHCTMTGWKGVALQTDTDNPAQHLYEREQWEKEEVFSYFWKNSKV